MMRHKRGDDKCAACRDGYPIPCTNCDGGLIHATKGCAVEYKCDRCAPPDEVLIGKEGNHDQ